MSERFNWNLHSTNSGCGGFTLIEVVVSLLIVGVIAAIAGMGIVTGTRGYLQTKENAHLAQKAQMAMLRIHRELMELTHIEAVQGGSDPYVIFDNPVGRQAIALDSAAGEILLYALTAGDNDISDNTGDVLADQVGGLTLTYHSGAAAWTTASEIELLSAIEVAFDLLAQESANTLSFSTTIHPRNTKNFGGAPPTGTPITAKQYQCFIGTAAPLQQVSAEKTGFTGKKGLLLAGLLLGTALLLLRRPTPARRRPPGAPDMRSGNVLVGLIVTMLIFAVLGAGMVSITGTTATSEVAANSAVQAYYLAEAGFRYAASQYLNAVDANGRYDSKDEKNQTLETLHGAGPFNLNGGANQFDLKVYPYYLALSNNFPLAATFIDTKFCGAQPDGFLLPPLGGSPGSAVAAFRIGDVTYYYNSYNSGTGRFSSFNPLLTGNEYQNGTVKLVGFPNGGATINRGDDLTLRAGEFFPPKQGKIQIAGISYGYENRNGNVLENITEANNPDQSFSVTVNGSTEVVVEPFVIVASTGIVGTGDLSATRKISYNTPLPEAPKLVEMTDYTDPFDNADNWSPTLGGFSAQAKPGEPGDTVLGVDSIASGLGTDAARIAFNWNTTKIQFPSAHRLAGRYLSYDSQVKLGFDPNPLPDNGYGPEGSPVPQYYDAGISFRLDENDNFLGLSFMRANPSASPADRIDNSLVPVDDTNLIVLWQNYNNGADRKWLAYAELGGLLTDGAELPPPSGKWTIDSPWARDTDFSRSGSYSWTTSPSGSYSDPPAGVTWNDSLTSESIDLTGAASASFSFWTRYRLYSSSDYGRLEISSNGGGTWNLLDSFNSNQDSFVLETYNLSAYLGQPDVRIRFRFERFGDGLTRDGWWVDDIRVTRDFDVQDAVMLARIYEAYLVTFDSGGTTEIKAGDVVFQSNGAFGVVIVPPILTGGSWAGDNAAGTLWLNKTSDTAFTNTLDVSIARTGGTDVANVVAVSPRKNLIKAFYGQRAGDFPTTPVDDTYDQLRVRNLPGTFNWPPVEGTAVQTDDDYYTLVEWNDTLNDGSVEFLADRQGRYTIIASDNPELFTPVSTFFPVTRPEIGLFATGNGALNTFFDDFGIRLYIFTGSTLNPVQQ